MSLTFDWLSPRQICFGGGRFAEIGARVAGFGRQALLVTGGRSLADSGRLHALLGQFAAEGLDWLHLSVSGEPTVEQVDTLATAARDFGPHVVAAVGGGSALDAGKAVAALLTNGGETLDYLEGVGRGRQLTAPALPVIAVPTTAGTGAEATKNAVIADAAGTFKKSMRSDGMLPALALVDPELAAGCPPRVAAACAMDSVTQLLETFTSRRANPLSDALAREGLVLSAGLIQWNGGPAEGLERGKMALASLLSGICLTNVGLGAVHGLAAPLGGLFDIPHGAVCAALGGAVVRANAQRAEREDDLATLAKYGAYHEILMRNRAREPAASASPDRLLSIALKLSDRLDDLRRRLGLSGLGDYGVTSADFPRIVAGARGASMQSNPVDLNDEELAEILGASL